MGRAHAVPEPARRPPPPPALHPLTQGAHLRVYNTFNPFSGFMSPTYILKSAKPVAQGEVAKVLKVRPRGGRLH